MSDSRRTDPPERIAQRRHRTTNAGEPVLPRIVERRPYPGDVHPIPKPVLRKFLPKIPLKYWYGLKSIELRARNGPIGEPFGLYRPSAKEVMLYSLPLTWRLTHVANWLEVSLGRYPAEIRPTDDGLLEVSWAAPTWAMMCIWFFNTILTHELGHHFNFQYRSRRPRVKGLTFEELHAWLHSARMEEHIFSLYPGKSPPNDSG